MNRSTEDTSTVSCVSMETMKDISAVETSNERDIGTDSLVDEEAETGRNEDTTIFRPDGRDQHQPRQEPRHDLPSSPSPPTHSLITPTSPNFGDDPQYDTYEYEPPLDEPEPAADNATTPFMSDNTRSRQLRQIEDHPTSDIDTSLEFSKFVIDSPLVRKLARSKSVEAVNRPTSSILWAPGAPFRRRGGTELAADTAVSSCETYSACCLLITDS